VTVTPPRVLYVTGWCRSGTTLIGNLLNEVDGVVHVGELRYLWLNGVLGDGTNSRCGCGQRVLDCRHWQQVFDCVVGDADLAAAAGRWVEAQARLLRTRHTVARLAEGLGLVPASPAARRLAERTVALYQAIGDTFGARIVVDSSKYPAEAALLVGADALDVRVLHVVRDPRATAHSWLRPKEYIPAMSPSRSTAYWTGFNVASELVRLRRPAVALRVRYEDFVREPRGTLARVLAFVGLDVEPPVGTDGSAVLGTNHTVTGNPDRLQRGPVTIHPDDRWRTELPAAATATATALALPLLPRYDYPIWPWPGVGATAVRSSTSRRSGWTSG
jgi:hypothetical protein